MQERWLGGLTAKIWPRVETVRKPQIKQIYNPLVVVKKTLSVNYHRLAWLYTGGKG